MDKNNLKKLSAFVLGGVICAGVVHYLERGKSPQKRNHFHPSQNFEEGDWDNVDESSYESFPASDPPSHSPTIAQ